MLSVDSFLSILPFAEEGNTAVLVIQWAFIVLLVVLSGMFSGLNLGLMSLDKLGLEVGLARPFCPFQSIHQTTYRSSFKVEHLRKVCMLDESTPSESVVTCFFARSCLAT